MKKLLLITVLIAVFTLLTAAPVSRNSARNIAEFQLEIKGKSDYRIADVYELNDDNNNVLAYVHHLDPQGYVIVTNDTDLPPVIAYSFIDVFRTEEADNLGYRFIKEDISNRLAARDITNSEILAANNTLWQSYLNRELQSFNTRDRSIYPPEGHTSTEGWVDMLWDQGFPWNMYCPYDDVNDGRSVTGCVATSLSMILAYHEYIGAANFTNSDDYTSSYSGFVVTIDNDYEENDFPDFPTLNNYLVDVQEHFAGVDPMSDHVKAAINFAAGVSVHMKYSSEASGAQVYYPGHNDSREALLYKFGYDSADGMYGSNPQLYDQFEEDMMNGRPIMIAILGGSEGHAILVDGWNSGDNTYHLNFGWNGYENGWYTLPYGMPQGYNVVNSAVLNIEGGGTLFDLLTLVNTADGTVPAGADIEFRGSRLYQGELDPAGAYIYDYMHEGTYNVSISFENPGGGYYYKSETHELNDGNDFLMITLDDYTELNGSVSGISNLENIAVSFYNEDGEIATCGFTDADGNYSITGVLPGEYLAAASYGENYFAVMPVEVTATQQTFDLVLEEYPYNETVSYSGPAGEIFHLIPNTISCAIKLTPDEVGPLDEAAFNGVSFKSPIAQADGELWVQIWHGNSLVSEQEVTDFAYGDMVNVTLDNFVPIDTEADYFVGFKVQSTNGDLAWFDTRTRVPGKGAWFRINSWTEVNPSFDHNFVITAHAVSLNMDGEEFDITPAVTVLGQNYPNPFNPSTNIEFSLAEDGFVSLEIFNIRGQKVKTLAASNFSAGNHILHWNGTDDSGTAATSGIYFYKMRNGRYTSTKKMILMK